MGKLKIDHSLVTPESAQALLKICPFDAFSYVGGKLDITAACKMCKMCTKKGDGAIEYVEETKISVDKSLWNGICVYVDHCGDKIHRAIPCRFFDNERSIIIGKENDRVVFYTVTDADGEAFIGICNKFTRLAVNTFASGWIFC